MRSTALSSCHCYGYCPRTRQALDPSSPPCPSSVQEPKRDHNGAKGNPQGPQAMGPAPGVCHRIDSHGDPRPHAGALAPRARTRGLCARPSGTQTRLRGLRRRQWCRCHSGPGSAAVLAVPHVAPSDICWGQRSRGTRVSRFHFLTQDTGTPPPRLPWPFSAPTEFSPALVCFAPCHAVIFCLWRVGGDDSRRHGQCPRGPCA